VHVIVSVTAGNGGTGGTPVGVGFGPVHVAPAGVSAVANNPPNDTPDAVAVFDIGNVIVTVGCAPANGPKFLIPNVTCNGCGVVPKCFGTFNTVVRSAP
jgi:hypothetical protein